MADGIYLKMQRIMHRINNGALSDGVAFVEGQLARGEKGDGTSLPNYSNSSLDAGKPFVGDDSNPAIRLFDEGDFYKSIVVANVLPDVVLIFARTEKPDVDLAVKYGQEIIQLSTESLNLITNEAKKGYIEYLKKVLS